MMDFTRRRFIGTAAYTGSGAAALRIFNSSLMFAAEQNASLLNHATGEQMAATPATFYRAYRSKPTTTPLVTSWLQIDLGESRAIDAVALYPACERMYPGRDQYYGGEGFPLRFKIEASHDAGFLNARTIVDYTTTDFPDPEDNITQYSASGVSGRYVRLTATELRATKTIKPTVEGAVDAQDSQQFTLTLAKMAVISGGHDIAVQCPVTADQAHGNPDDLSQITRPLRPQGEGIVTDHPENLVEATSWKPAKYKAQRPLTGVTLAGGIFQAAIENNISYLLNSFTVDELLSQFRERAGKPNPPGLPKPNQFWEVDLAGSNAGRFLMGAGNTLRWVKNAELLSRMNAVIDGIEECRQANGYIMAYPENTIFFSERGAYTRAWLTHGLIDAGYGGNPKAFGLLRGYYDWFNQCEYLPKLLRGAIQGGQGMIANTRMCLTPVGKPSDAQVIQQYFQENFWLEGLSRLENQAVWQYPYDHPHCYLLTNLEAYLDMYTTTGDKRYHDAVLGGWTLYREKWEQIGGSISIIEFENDPPDSEYLHQKLGENCGSSFWILLSQRFHLYYPDEEKYVTEIEKSIYNVILANQGGTNGIRYHTILVGKKEDPTHINTCCEGQGTRQLGSLPEHIYSIAPDGLYVNLYEPSSITWSQSGQSMQLKMVTSFPLQPEVKLVYSAARTTLTKIHIRVPSWATSSMQIYVNNSLAATGDPGSYASLDRSWSDGDTISFNLPIGFRLTCYTGRDQIPGHQRYALEYGPILMTAVGTADMQLHAKGDQYPEDFLQQLKPKQDKPLHFTIEDNPNAEYMPYWEVQAQSFTCFPVIDIKEV